MGRKRKAIILFCGFILLSILNPPLTSSEETELWWNSRFSVRVPVIVKETLEVERKNSPVIVKGSQIRTAARSYGYRLSRMRLIHNGQEIPFQVDERDRTGIPLFEGGGNGILDPDDEFIFQVNLQPGETKRFDLYLPIADNEIPDRSYDGSTKWMQAIGGKREFDLFFENGLIGLGTRGGAGLKAPNAGFGGGGRGRITSLIVNHRQMVHIGYAWGNGLFRSSILDRLEWTSPVPVISGPARATMMTDAITFDIDWGGKKLKGDAHRIFHIYNGLPYIEVEELIEFYEPQEDITIDYNSTLSPSGGSRDWINERIFISAAGKITAEDYKKPLIKSKGRADWIALQNPVRNLGLAVFLPAANNDTTVGFSPPPHTIEKIMESPYSSVHAQASFSTRLTYKKVKKISHRFGLYGLKNETSEEISKTYSVLWINPLSRSVVVKPMEVRDEN